MNEEAARQDLEGEEEHEDEEPFPTTIVLGGVGLPMDVFVEILDFLPKPDLVHRASLASWPWTRPPNFHPCGLCSTRESGNNTTRETLTCLPLSVESFQRCENSKSFCNVPSSPVSSALFLPTCTRGRVYVSTCLNESRLAVLFWKILTSQAKPHHDTVRWWPRMMS